MVEDTDFADLGGRAESENKGRRSGWQFLERDLSATP